MSNPVGRPRKLSTVLAESDAIETQSAKSREITTDEAAVLVKLGMSGADINDKARRAVTHFLEVLTNKDEIDDAEAKICIDVLRQLATSDQKALCNKVLLKYVSKFDFAQPKKESLVAA